MENSSEYMRVVANMNHTPATHEANASLLVMPNQPELEGSQPQPRSSSRGTGRTSLDPVLAAPAERDPSLDLVHDSIRFGWLRLISLSNRLQCLIDMNFNKGERDGRVD